MLKLRKILGRGFLYLSISGLILFSGCLNNDEDCIQRDAFANQELYFLTDDVGANYLSFGPTLETAIRVCEQNITPVDSVGFENIYSVDGVIVGDCRAPGCIEATAYSDPFCVIEIPESEEKFELLGRWQIAYLERNNQRIHPSCLQLSENLIIGTNSDSTVYQILSAFAFSNLIVDFQPRNNNNMRISDVIADAAEGPVYLELFERSVLEFFQSSENVIYDIRNNVMTMHFENDRLIVLFANP